MYTTEQTAVVDVRVHGPYDETETDWTVSGDLRLNDNYDNYEVGAVLDAVLFTTGLAYTSDFESSCAYYYVADEATAIALKAVIETYAVRIGQAVPFAQKGLR